MKIPGKAITSALTSLDLQVRNKADTLLSPETSRGKKFHEGKRNLLAMVSASFPHWEFSCAGGPLAVWLRVASNQKQ